MSGSDLSPRMDESLEVIEQTCEEMVAAADADDLQRVLQLLEQRGRAILQLEGVVDATSMADKRPALDRGAARAAQGIRRLMERVQTELSRLSLGKSAVRSYNPSSPPATALDRSG